MTAKGYFDPGTRLGAKEGVNPDDLAQAGWGVVFAEDADPRVRDSLEELLEHRRGQAGALFQVYAGERAYRRGEDKWDFMARFGGAPGPVDPEKIPYYLLLVGDPESIPFPFQYQLDVEHAVGRICFDRPEDYAAYARSVVAAERDPARVLARGAGRPRATFFAPKNAGDETTAGLADRVVAPLADWVRDAWDDWEVRTLLGEEATKGALVAELGEGATPALLFAAAHGVRLPSGHPAQRRHQGALVCQEWSRGRPAGPDCYFWADDAEPTAPHGLIAFFLACHGAGTPRLDSFELAGRGSRLAPEAFAARLPQRLLAHPGGGALAAVGHVDKALGYAFLWGGEQLESFKSTLKRLLDGGTIGSAMEYFDHRYSELAAGLAELMRDAEWGREPDDVQLVRMWTAHNDARGYVVFGDPAVRLPRG